MLMFVFVLMLLTFLFTGGEMMGRQGRGRPACQMVYKYAVRAVRESV